MRLDQELRIYENINIGIIIVSQNDGSIIDMNSYALKLLLIESVDSVKGSSFSEIVTTQNDAIFNISHSGGIEDYFKRTDGSFFYGELTINDLRGTEYFIVTLRDADKERIIIEKLKILENDLLKLSGIGEVIFESEAMREIYKLCKIFNKERSVNVLIEGETGTGKEIVAKLIHYGDNNVTNTPFIDINCPAIPDELFESEIFGYEKGSFTGAGTMKPGKFELASDGTIFLDEIGELPLHIQPKILRVLQEREFYRIGSSVSRKINARFIAATNRDLKKVVDNGLFREDLYYRLNVGYIKVPPLRERKGDIEKLVTLFFRQICTSQNKTLITVPPEVMDIFCNYNWPGNVRELRNTVEKIVTFNNGSTLNPENIDFTGSGNLPFKYADLINDSFDMPDSGFSLEQIDKIIVKKVLAKFHGNKTKAASYLGLTRSALRSRL